MAISKFWLVVLLMTLTTTLLISGEAEPYFRRYAIESAVVSYEINGSGKIAEKSQVTIDGIATLIFADWGVRQSYLEYYTKSTSGGIKKTEVIRTLFVEDHGMVYKVDFDKEKIEKNVNPMIKDAISSKKDLYLTQMEELKSKGKKVGSSVVLGLQCEEWQVGGNKLCYYQGIVLKEESKVSGITLVKTAVNIEYEAIPEDAFALPDMALLKQKGYLLEPKEQYIANAPQKPSKAQTATASDGNNTEEIPEDAQSQTAYLVKESDAETLFKQQKEMLQTLLTQTQEARVCLENADDKSEAEKCIEEMVYTKEEIYGDKDQECGILDWTDSVKTKRLEKLEDEIMNLKRKMPCIRGSRNYEDLSGCMSD